MRKAQEEVIIAGFGGQGVMFAGQVLAYAGLHQGKHVTYVPAYGPEMRGGTAYCGVILADEEIGSPVVTEPTAAVVMNAPSMEKYEPLVKPGGFLIINHSLVKARSQRDDITVVEVPANDLATELGDDRLANMVMVGSLVAATHVVPLEAAEWAVEMVLPPHRLHLLAKNQEAIRHGAALVGSSA